MFEKIKKFLKREKKDYIEFEEEEKEKEKITVRMEKLGGMVDVERIARLVMEGNIVFLSTKDLQKKDLTQFQNSLQKLKRYCNQYGWDIAGTEDGYLVITPKFASIARE